MERQEQIRKAKELLACGALSKEACDAIKADFPELRESEDERIRKGLIAFLRYYHFGQGDSQPFNEDWIAYLEKQSTPQIRTGLEWANAIDNACDKLYLEEYSHGEHCHEQSFKWGFQEGINWLEKQKEQNPATPWTIQDAHPGDILNSARVQATIIFKGFNPDGKHIDAYCALQKGIFIAQEMLWDRDFEPAAQVRKDAIFDAMARKGYLWDAENKRLNKAVQQPSEWSEEDEKMLNDCIMALSNWRDAVANYGHEVAPCQKLIDWLKSLPERFNLQPKQEWSEEDEALIENVCTALKGYALHERKVDLDEHAHRLEEMSERLKSLRPQPHWKPSEEQVEALKYALGNGGKYDKEALESLYNDLKKL